MNEPERPLENLLDVPVQTAVWRLAWPTIVLGLLRSGYLLAGSYWASQAGDSAMAALAGVTFATWIVYSLAEISATGTYSLVAQAVGANDARALERSLGAGLQVAMVVGFLAAATLYFGETQYQDLLGTTEVGVRSLSQSYLHIWSFAIIPNVLFSTILSAFRGMGRTDLPLRLSGMVFVINAILDPILILGISDLEGMGLSGAAVASVISYGLGLVLGYKHLRAIGVRPRIKRADTPACPGLARIGLPLAISWSGFSLIYVFLGRIINHFGPEAMAGLGIGHRLESLGFLACTAFQMAATTLVGQWTGAGDLQRAQAVLRQIRLQLVRVILPLSLLIVVPASHWVTYFNTDPLIQQHARDYLLVVGSTLVFSGLEVLYEGAFAGRGRTLPSLLIAFPLTAARIPLAHLLAIELGFGTLGIWLAIAATTVIKAFCLMTWYHRDDAKVRAGTGLL